MRMRTPLAISLAALTSTACLQPQEAPADLDGLARFFFDRFDPVDEDPAVSDIEMHDAIAKLHDVLGGADMGDEHAKGTMGKMTATELEVVGRTDLEPARAVGLTVSGIVHCSLDRMQDLS